MRKPQVNPAGDFEKTKSLVNSLKREMRIARRAILAAICLSLAGLLCLAVGARAEMVEFQALCSKVTDGDTLVVVPSDSNGRTAQPEIIRLACIDAPETAQPYGPHAAEYARKLAEGRPITVRVIAREYYGRLLAHITVRGKDLATEMVGAGLAWATCKNLRDLQKAAMLLRVGLWAQPKPENPRKYRQRVR